MGFDGTVYDLLGFRYRLTGLKTAPRNNNE